jgi:glucan phosphoethanolaminetransferase (alkaline phosphatase superfamily)
MISDFLLSTWLFSVTYDWFHIIINTAVLSILLHAFLRMGTSRAIMLSFSAHFFAFVVYAVVAISVFFNYVLMQNVLNEVSETSKADDIFLACLYLAFVYAVLQSIFLLLMHIRSESRLRRIIEIVWLSNGISALLSYLSIIFFIFPIL